MISPTDTYCPFLYDGTMVETGTLVGANEFEKIINGNVFLAVLRVILMPDHDPGSVHIHHHAFPLGDDSHAGILGDHPFNACTHQRCLIDHQGHGLALHVGSHQGPVGIIVFEKGNQRCRDADQLVGGDIHQFDVLAFHHGQFALYTGGDHRIDVFVFLVEWGIGLGNRMFFFFKSTEELDFAWLL